MTEHRGELVVPARTARARRLAASLVALALLPGGAIAQAASGGAGLWSGTAPPVPVAKKHPTSAKRSPAKKPTTVRHSSAGSSTSPFARRGMWIWYVSQSDGGALSSIIADARRYGIGTLMIKSGDGSGSWSQFSPSLVRTLHAAGLKVCGWQYVYGNDPVGEAQVGAATARNGADCLMIDAEGEYEGKYARAQSYITALRSSIGSHFPLALAGLPYVDYHPAFPYSVFLGHNGAQYNAPQMYWVDIGTTVDAVYAHTYSFNGIYGRRILPLGQLSGRPSSSEVHRFRQLARAYRAPNISWWDWQEASAGSWNALSEPLASLSGYGTTSSLASLGRGAQGDAVVWAQEHLYTAGYRLAIDGDFGRGTLAAVKSFQSAHGIPSTGSIGNLTWHALLRFPPVRVRWSSGRARVASVSRAGSGIVSAPPRSARLPARRDEVRSLGRG